MRGKQRRVNKAKKRERNESISRIKGRDAVVDRAQSGEGAVYKMVGEKGRGLGTLGAWEEAPASGWGMAMLAGRRARELELFFSSHIFFSFRYAAIGWVPAASLPEVG